MRLTSDGTIENITDNVIDLLRRSADSLIGRPAIALVHPDDATLAEAAWTQILNQSPPFEPVRCRFLAPDEESTRWFEATSWNALDDPSAAAVITELRTFS